MNFLNLIRWKNLLLIATVQLLIKYALLKPFGVQTALSSLGISLLMLATLCIAAAGYIINDIFDVETDSINKPEKLIVGKSISEKTAYNLFFIFNMVGVGVGYYVSHLVNKDAFFSLFVIISVLLYVYASYLKQMLLVGNIIVAILVALSLVIVGVFELLPTLTPLNRQTQLFFFKILLNYALFAFFINLLREIIKDMEDINGDYKAGMNTLPIAIGIERSAKVVFVLTIVLLFAVGYYVVNVLYKNQIMVLYFLVFIMGPLLYLAIKMFSANTKKEFHQMSQVLKLVMLFGMGSLLFYLFLLKL
ncbi:geranylgeranylglycerol-phosphate geranylgeranyltransferase [Mariniflexile maritimum]|uniref:geranylgeranylglycerol-phosphate geranylgeranyltransferase n=1 Tax=Mariniflexile maritimum TaxID=2682493 RepID=UPI0012F6C7BC|nr:geranylgeranylglycerol-phosphate geranylgeranyltransferase [Mariniflexile maritimum]